MSTTQRVPVGQLREFSMGVLTGLGTPEDIADVVTSHLVGADTKGMASHGVIHIPSYAKGIEAGHLKVAARPDVDRETKSTATVNAHGGWGHFAASWSMDLAMRKAKETGMCAVSLTDAGHIGRLGTYAEQAAAGGYLSIVSTGGGGPRPDSGSRTPPSDNVIDRLTYGGAGAAPYGGAKPALGTNPISFGAPSK